MPRPLHLFLLVAVSACTSRGSGSSAAAARPAPLTDASSAEAAAPTADASSPGDGSSNDGGPGATDASLEASVPPLTPLPVTANTWGAQVLYLVMPDRFSNGDPSNDGAVAGCLDPTNPSMIHGGDFVGLASRIPYLHDLGITSVWITPAYLQSKDRCGYHGYWADFVDPDDGAIAPNLGSASDLGALVNALHAAGIRLFLDMVVNHAGITARVVTQHPSWFHNPATCASLGDPAVYCPIGGKPLPDFAQEMPAVATYLTGVSVGWATRFGIDAVRMDTVKNVLPSYWASSWFPGMRAAMPSLFVVGEDFDESGPAALLPYLNDGFDSLFDYPRYAALVTTFAQGGTVDGLATAVASAISTYGMGRALKMTSFVDNHDNPRLTSNVPAGTSGADTSLRLRLALGAIFTLPGIPQLMWGDEIGMLGAADPDNRRDMPSWAWSAATRAGPHAGMSVGDGQAGYAFVQKLIATRGAHTALQKGSYAEMWRQNGGPANVLAFLRSDGNDRILVALNPGPAATVSLKIAGSQTLAAADKAALADGTILTDALGAGAPMNVTVSGGLVSVALPAQTMGIYLAP